MNRTWIDVVREHQQVIAALADQAPILDAIVAALVGCFRQGGRVYTLGNGGSAADAQHIAGELLGRFRRERAPLPVQALSADVATLTALGNDYGYEQVFARQLEALVRPGDVVWALSTSGTSPNVLAAVQVARARGATVIGFTGQNGAALAEHCTHVFRVPHAASERIQEAHALAYHYLCERVEATL